MAPTEIGLDPAGWVGICWSMSIGNARRTSLSDLLKSYDHREHPVIRILVDRGPMALLNLPEARGFELRKERYPDRCQLCIEVRKFMRETYPEIYTRAA